MRALTIVQPWASAIVHGPKRIENRTWMPPRQFIGDVIAIHAGKKWDDDGWHFCREHGYDAALDLPRGHLIGVAKLVAVRTCTMEQGIDPNRPDPWFVGPYGWVFEDVRALAVPIRCMGAIGLWEIESEDLARMRGQLEAAGR